MPPTTPDTPARTAGSPLLELLERAHTGELPLAAAIPALVGSPAAAPALARFHRELRRRRLPVGHPLPWAAVCLGLDAPERCVPRDLARADRLAGRLRRLPPDRRLGALQRARAESYNPALVDAFIAAGRRALAADPAETLGWLELAALVISRLATAGFPERLLYTPGLRLAAHRADALRAAGELEEADRRFRRLADDPRRRELARLDLEAELLSLEAALRTDQQRPAAARELRERARRLRRLADIGPAARSGAARSNAGRDLDPAGG